MAKTLTVTSRPSKAENLRVIAQRTAEQRAVLTLALYRRNAEALEKMQCKAEETGRKVGGYTAEQLRDHAVAYRRMSKGLPPCAS